MAVYQDAIMPVTADEVKLDDALRRQTAEEGPPVVAVVDGVDVQVRHVEQQAAVRPRDLRQGNPTRQSARPHAQVYVMFST